MVLGNTRTETVSHTHEQDQEDLELPLFDLSRIAVATDNFSINNKLGEGGYGPVYKVSFKYANSRFYKINKDSASAIKKLIVIVIQGTLDGGRQIAVKRLSSSSGQGLNEFKNEVMLIAKLKHRNLVKLIGCCIQEEEKLLIYEYMPNRSLDYFIFGQDPLC